MTDKDYATLGKVVTEFTSTENVLRECGAFIDKAIACEDSEAFLDCMAELWIKVSSLKQCMKFFEETISNHIKSNSSEEVVQ